MGIAYVTYNQLVEDIRRNIWKVPRDIDLILGIPRSGLLPASIIAQYLDKNIMIAQRFAEVVENGEDLKANIHHGHRIDFLDNRNNKEIRNILVVDDTVYGGIQKKEWRDRFSKDCYKDFNFIFLVVYKEGSGNVDIHFVDNRVDAMKSDYRIVLYEWNLFCHTGLVHTMAFDIDGVICYDPPDERNLEQYLAYIKNPVPYRVPKIDKIGTTIVTYRLKKYKQETENFLKSVGLSGSVLYMVDAESYEDRAKMPPEVYKSNIYANSPHLKLFVESNDYQARMINQITKKPVFCVETNKVYDFR